MNADKNEKFLRLSALICVPFSFGLSELGIYKKERPCYYLGRANRETEIEWQHIQASSGLNPPGIHSPDAQKSARVVNIVTPNGWRYVCKQ
jgi:hypothetical protein